MRYGKIATIQALVIVLALIGWYGGTIRVDEREFVVVTRFGEPVREIRDAGLYLKTPFIESAYRIEKRMFPYDINPYDVQTRDHKFITVDYLALLRVEEPTTFLTRMGSVENAKSRVDTTLFNLARNTIGTTDYAEVLGGGRERLEQAILAAANATFHEYGMSIPAIRIVGVDLPEANRDAVFNQMIAERNAIAAEIVADGGLQRDRIKATADRDARTIVASAQENAERIRGEGDAEAARLYNEAYSGPGAVEFYRLFRAAEVMRMTVTNGTRIFLTGEEPHLREILTDQTSPPTN